MNLDTNTPEECIDQIKEDIQLILNRLTFSRDELSFDEILDLEDELQWSRDSLNELEQMI